MVVCLIKPFLTGTKAPCGLPELTSAAVTPRGEGSPNPNLVMLPGELWLTPPAASPIPPAPLPAVDGL